MIVVFQWQQPPKKRWFNINSCTLGNKFKYCTTDKFIALSCMFYFHVSVNFIVFLFIIVTHKCKLLFSSPGTINLFYYTKIFKAENSPLQDVANRKQSWAGLAWRPASFNTVPTPPNLCSLSPPNTPSAVCVSVCQCVRERDTEMNEHLITHTIQLSPIMKTVDKKD